jgi:hypothetical protein
MGESKLFGDFLSSLRCLGVRTGRESRGTSSRDVNWRRAKGGATQALGTIPAKDVQVRVCDTLGFLREY